MTRRSLGASLRARALTHARSCPCCDGAKSAARLQSAHRRITKACSHSRSSTVTRLAACLAALKLARQLALGSVWAVNRVATPLPQGQPPSLSHLSVRLVLFLLSTPSSLFHLPFEQSRAPQAPRTQGIPRYVVFRSNVVPSASTHPSFVVCQASALPAKHQPPLAPALDSRSPRPPPHFCTRRSGPSCRFDEVASPCGSRSQCG